MWGGRTRKDSGGNGVSGGNGAGGRRVWLHELVEAITTALIAATRPIQEQHIAAVQETFTSTETKPQANGPQRDLMTDSEGGPQSGFNQQSGIRVAVPTAALMQSNALVIDEATIELECVFDRFATETDGRPRLGVWLDKTGSGSPARIVVKFKRVDRPEGASRIEDALLRNIQ